MMQGLVMRMFIWLTLLSGVFTLASASVPPQPPFPVVFRTQEIDRTLKVGYSVITADVNGDNKPDIVVADAQRVIWFENPTWKLHTILAGQTKPDNVSIAAADIDRDGKVDFALAADWKPMNTKSGGTLQWLKRGRTLDEPWTLHPIADDIPTVHRIRFAHLDDLTRPQLMVVPLMGRNSSASQNWMETPVEILSYAIPSNPATERWPVTTLDRSLHVVHNFQAAVLEPGKTEFLAASYEGITWFKRDAAKWQPIRLGHGDQSQPAKNRGCSEVKLGYLKDQQPIIATIEPWHGNQVVVYRPSGADLTKPWQRTVLDDKLKWGHALAWADIDGDGNVDLVVGVRDNLSNEHPCGVRVYRLQADGTWNTQRVDPGGVAVEDLIVADLNDDKRQDIIAVGRATGNVRIYWGGE
jgi:hypothetical protein